MVSEGFFSMCSRNGLMKVKGKFSNNMDAIALLVYLLEMSNRETANATQIISRLFANACNSNLMTDD